MFAAVAALAPDVGVFIPGKGERPLPASCSFAMRSNSARRASNRATFSFVAIVALSVLINTLADLAYAALNPMVRYGGGHG